MEKIKVFSTTTCPYCNVAKDFLKDKGVVFEEIDVASDREAAKEMVEKTGQMGVPVIMVGDKAVIGFDKEKIEELIG